MRESLKLRSKSIIQPALMTKKNFKKDYPNLLEELVFSRSEEALRSRSIKLKTEFKMLFVLLKQLSRKELL